MSTRPYLFVINSLAPGGAERSLVELLPKLVERGVRPVVVCLYQRVPGFQEEVLSGGFDLRFLKRRRLLGRARELRGLIRDENPLLIHTTLFEADLVGRLAAIGSGVPVMTTLANTTYDPQRIRADANLNRVKVWGVKAIDGLTARHLTDHFHAVSGAVKASLVESLRLDPETVTVIHRGRDPERLGRRTEARRASARSSLGLEADTELILNVGRHEFQKGQHHLIKAFADVVTRRPKASLAIAGRPGNATGSIERLVDQLGLENKVSFLGHRGDVPDLLVAADLFVFPSLWEGLGGALIEALALEVPIVATDLPAVREVVVDEVTGLLVPPGDEGLLAKSIEVLLGADPGRRLVAGNRSRFETIFDLDICANRLMDLMDAVALSEDVAL